MFALSVRFGKMQPHIPKRPCLHVFAKFGGKYLGDIDLPCFSNYAFTMVRALQERCVKLLVHASRPTNYLVVSLDGHALPAYTHVTHHGNDSGTQVCACLSRLPKVEVHWMEQDEHALARIAQVYGDLASKDGRVVIRQNATCTSELDVLSFALRPQSLHIMGCNGWCTLDFLAGRLYSPIRGFQTCWTALRELSLFDCKVNSWRFATHLVLKHLELSCCQIADMPDECFQHDFDITVRFTCRLKAMNKLTKLKHLRLLAMTTKVERKDLGDLKQRGVLVLGENDAPI